MATKNDLYTKLISMKSGIEDKGGTVNLNPSPDELNCRYCFDRYWN